MSSVSSACLDIARYPLFQVIMFCHVLTLRQGKEVKLDIFAYTESENMRPEPFKARFLPRSARIHRLVMEEAAVAREALRKYDGETRLTMEDAARNPAWV